jgi:hypothetical protein
VTKRFERNGYDWDIRGTLYRPERETMPGVGFALTHGGAGSELELVETPDGRPGLAPILAAQGFRVLVFSFPGHLPAEGRWRVSVEERQPCYLLDRPLGDAEVSDRNLRCTFDTIVSGAAHLIDEHMAGMRLLSFGHSTGGPMSIALQRFLTKADVIGIVGWGSGGPDGWYREWVDWFPGKKTSDKPLDSVARRSVASFRNAGYEDPLDICPWGNAERYFEWANLYKAQFKTSLCDNQHEARIEQLLKYAQRTDLPPEEYVAYLRDPDPDWLARISVLLCVGESDRNHWMNGKTEDDKLEIFMARKFAARTRNTKLAVVPRYGHFGFVGAHNEAIAYTWLQALKDGFFSGARA